MGTCIRELAVAVVGVAAAMSLGAAGCVADSPDDRSQSGVDLDDLTADVDLDELTADMELVYIYGTHYEPSDSSLALGEQVLYDIPQTGQSMLMPGRQSQSAYPADPCECSDQAGCLEGWAGENLGCNVCAVFVCGQEVPNPHVCHFCSM